MSFGLSKEICELLCEELTVHYRQGPGGKYPYVKGEDVIRQLNKAFNHSWSSEVVKDVERDDQILVLVSLTVWIDGDTVTHQGYGSSKIARHRGDNSIIDIGNNYKSAYTNALKKAAEQFGIGLGGEAAAPSAPSKSSYQPRPSSSKSKSRAAPKAPQGLRQGAGSRPPLKKPAPFPSRSANPSPRTAAPKASPAPAKAAGPDMTVPATDSQLTALSNIAKIRRRDEVELVTGALPDSGKSSFSQLTKGEAITVIKYANSLIQG